MQNAILLTSPGGVEHLVAQKIAIPTPAPGEVLVRHKAVGLNFIDIYHRTGFYPLPTYPTILGLEAAGVVEAVGEHCSRFRVGNRVAYGAGPLGAYCEQRVIPEHRLALLPDSVSFEDAASLMLKGMTAYYLLHRTAQIGRQHTILVHAAAGGVGLLLCQWAKHLGARVIGTIGSESKAARAKAAGCDDVILYRQQDVAQTVRDITAGKGVHVVYDAIGKDTYTASLNSLAKLGLFVSYGQASGPLPAIESQELSRRGSLFFTRPTLMDYVETPEMYREASESLLTLVANGTLSPYIGQRFALSEIGEAHRLLESGKTEGSTILHV